MKNTALSCFSIHVTKKQPKFGLNLRNFENMDEKGQYAYFRKFKGREQKTVIIFLLYKTPFLLFSSQKGKIYRKIAKII
jgi:hypothetical protein